MYWLIISNGSQTVDKKKFLDVTTRTNLVQIYVRG